MKNWRGGWVRKGVVLGCGRGEGGFGDECVKVGSEGRGLRVEVG